MKATTVQRSTSQTPRVPVSIVQIELARALEPVPIGGAAVGNGPILALVRLLGQPVGVIEHEERTDDPQQLAELIWDSLGTEVAARLKERSLPVPSKLGPEGLTTPGPAKQANGHATPITVVIATHNRPASLKRTLDSVLASTYLSFRVVVVDNAPSSDESARLVEAEYGHLDSVRYVREATPGLAIAHNRGLREVETPLVAFTDDDVLVDPIWLAEIAQAFASSPEVGCVTGLVFPAELTTEAQAWAEAYWGFKKGFTSRLFNLRHHRVQHPLYPYAAGFYGTGANMAFRTSVLKEMGGFDVALGVGTRTRGGDDLAAFFETIQRGNAIMYVPSAIVYHSHHRDTAALERQAIGYGSGLTAYLTKVVADRPWLLLDMARRLPSALRYILAPDSAKNARRPQGFPEGIVRAERKGMLQGPFLFLKSRWSTRRLRNGWAKP